jgi:phenylacetate-coenzyme A ligase PaaK-like adenylate-forming protein
LARVTSWDRRNDSRRHRLQDELVRAQARAVAGGSAYWKQRFAAIGRSPATISGAAALESVPAVGERDVSPNGDPAAMAGLVLHGGERHFALHAPGPQLRRALRLRATRSSAYRRVVDSETRPTTYAWSGLGFRYPLAYTRGDLDVVARAGARMWQVLGLSDADALVSAYPVGATVEHTALQYAALAAGAPALFPGAALDSVVAAARLAPPTVVAVATQAAGDVVAALAEAGALERLTTLLLVGVPSDAERAAAAEALAAAGRNASVLAVHAPSGSRVLWAECRQSAGATGLHTYPDLDLVQVVDAETGEPATPAPGSGAVEVVVTQLGMRGSALLRWRTGDLASGVDDGACPSCGRAVARVLETRRAALVVVTDTGRALDLRAVAGALAGRADLADWRVVVGGRDRDGRGQVVVHLAPAAATDTDPGEVTVAAAADIRAVAGMLPSQLVVADADELGAIDATALTPRLLVRR